MMRQLNAERWRRLPFILTGSGRGTSRQVQVFIMHSSGFLCRWRLPPYPRPTEILSQAQTSQARASRRAGQDLSNTVPVISPGRVALQLCPAYRILSQAHTP